eukprot:TRINITY_DN1217_c0_g1_i2.p1 TRINITY_DN1217_c0_g1~~TRINITY_DN1217_c0_g1_i2.p1  ORF type:complete len:232 (-),score=30.73 TRINITY_DN1217_c0_g1_i2:10-705(-)
MKCRRLCRIELAKCTKIQSDAIILLVRNLRQLEYLNLEACFPTDRAIFQIAKHCSNLTWLSLAGCTNLNGESISAIADGLPSITSLNLSNLPKITDNTVFQLGKYLPNLRKIDLQGCSRVTARSGNIFKLRNSKPQVSFQALMLHEIRGKRELKHSEGSLPKPDDEGQESEFQGMVRKMQKSLKERIDAGLDVTTTVASLKLSTEEVTNCADPDEQVDCYTNDVDISKDSD